MFKMFNKFRISDLKSLTVHCKHPTPNILYTSQRIKVLQFFADKIQKSGA